MIVTAYFCQKGVELDIFMYFWTNLENIGELLGGVYVILCMPYLQP